MGNDVPIVMVKVGEGDGEMLGRAMEEVGRFVGRRIRFIEGYDV